MNTAVLFLVFNRPETTARVFDAIRKARPRRLYVACDGPRDNNPNDKKLCDEVRSIVASVDWACEVKRLYRDQNLGCGRAVREAIDWFFEHEESGIILEDDCLPDSTWFRFAEELLERFADQEKVMCISASHFPGDEHVIPKSYFFSIYNHCWGWATWRRAWKCCDFEMQDWPKLRKSSWLLELGSHSRSFKRYWSQIFDRTYSGQIDTWDYYWTYSVWRHQGLTILPAKNLVQNLGFGPDATHTMGADSAGGSLRLQSIQFPLDHPEDLIVDDFADKWTARNHYGISLIGEMKKTMYRIPLVGKLAAKLARGIRKARF